MLTKLKTRQTPVVLASYISHLDYRQMLLELETTFSVPHVELLSLFPEAHNFEQLVEQFSLGWDNHLNAQAHKRWAEAIARLIDENSYVSTN